MWHAHAFEFRRQLAHITFGVLVLWGIYFDILTVKTLAVGVVVLYYVLWFIKRGFKIPVFYEVLCFFERECHLKEWPGRGMFYFLLGAFLSVLFFEKNIVYASLAILIAGDSVTNVAGRHLGRIKNPLNHKKTIEGTIAGIIVSFLVCSLFFPYLESFIAAFVAMIIEIPEIKIRGIHLDDNLTIPLAAGLVLTLFSL